MVAIEESEVNKRLAAWAGIFAVATAFASIWGMNFADMPELHWKYGYPVALCLMAGVCGFMFWRFKKSGWLKGATRNHVTFPARIRSEEHTSELQSLMRISYAVFGLKKKHKISRTRR